MAEHKQSQQKPLGERANGEREALIAEAQAKANGGKVFDISAYPALIFVKIESEKKSLAEVGISASLLKEQSERGEAARRVIFSDDGKSYRHTLSAYCPMIRASEFASPESLLNAMTQWLKAIDDFKTSAVAIGKKTVIDASVQRIDSENALSYLASVMLKGISLLHQGPMASNERLTKPALEHAAREGFTASSTPKAKRGLSRVEEEI